MTRPGRKTSRGVPEISRSTEYRRSKQHGLQAPQGVVPPGVPGLFSIPPGAEAQSPEQSVRGFTALLVVQIVQLLCDRPCALRVRSYYGQVTSPSQLPAKHHKTCVLPPCP